jgi:hypothetical protein
VQLRDGLRRLPEQRGGFANILRKLGIIAAGMVQRAAGCDASPAGPIETSIAAMSAAREISSGS